MFYFFKTTHYTPHHTTIHKTWNTLRSNTELTQTNNLIHFMISPTKKRKTVFSIRSAVCWLKIIFCFIFSFILALAQFWYRCLWFIMMFLFCGLIQFSLFFLSGKSFDVNSKFRTLYNRTNNIFVAVTASRTDSLTNEQRSSLWTVWNAFPKSWTLRRASNIEHTIQLIRALNIVNSLLLITACNPIKLNIWISFWYIYVQYSVFSISIFNMRVWRATSDF